LPHRHVLQSLALTLDLWNDADSFADSLTVVRRRCAIVKQDVRRQSLHGFSADASDFIQIMKRFKFAMLLAIFNYRRRLFWAYPLQAARYLPGIRAVDIYRFRLNCKTAQYD
jgi:hypothetical protein